MRKKIGEQLRMAWDVGKRYAFCVVWMLMLQTLSCLGCWGVLLLFGRDYELEWLVYTVGFLLPFLWGIMGRCLPKHLRIVGRWQNLIFWLLFLVLPAGLSWWADQGGPESLWMVFTPQLMARLAWFNPLFDGPQSAYVLNTLRPMAAGGTHLVLMAGFLAGLWLGRKKKKPAYT